MGSKIGGMCGSEDRGKGEITLSNGNTTNAPAEVIKAKSAVRIQSKWKSKRVEKVMKKLIFTKQSLDEKSTKDCEFITLDQMKEKISQNVLEFEKKLDIFNREPEEETFKYCFFRDPVRLLDKSIYYGQWNESGQKHGYGVLVQANGSKYEGFFCKDKISGRGRYIDHQGQFYYEGKYSV